MTEQGLPKEIKEAICDRLQGWELIDFLSISIEDVVELIEDDIVEKLDDVLEYIGLYGLEEHDDEGD